MTLVETPLSANKPPFGASDPLAQRGRKRGEELEKTEAGPGRQLRRSETLREAGFGQEPACDARAKGARERPMHRATTRGEARGDEVTVELAMLGLDQRWSALTQSQHHHLDARSRHEVIATEHMHDRRFEVRDEQ